MSVLFQRLNLFAICFLLYPISAYSKPPLSTNKYQWEYPKPTEYYKTKEGSLIHIGDGVLEKISPERGGGKSLDFSIPEDECTPKDLKKIHSIQGLREIGLPKNSGDAELKAIQGYRDLEFLYVGDWVTVKGLAVLKTFPNLKIVYFWNNWNKRKLKGIGIKHLTECSSLERLDVPVFLPGTDYAPLLKMKQLKRLSLTVNKDSIKIIPQLSQLRHLESLTLDIPPQGITSKELVLILNQMKLKQLKSLGVRPSDKSWVITPEVIEEISKMKNLEKLFLSQCQLENQYLEKISRLKNLRYLSIRNPYESAARRAKISYFDISQLKDLKKLEKININGWSPFFVPRSNLKILKQFPNLQSLNFSYSKQDESKGAFVVTDEDLRRYIAPLKNLKKLYLIGQPEVTDKGILHLTGLKRLKTWNFDKTDKISKKGIQTFRKRFAQTKPLKKK